MELDQQIARHGWEMVSRLRTFQLTEHEAEALFFRLDWLKTELPKLLDAFRGGAS